jgi:hypothetical protein
VPMLRRVRAPSLGQIIRTPALQVVRMLSV